MQIEFSKDTTFYVTGENQSPVTNWGSQISTGKHGNVCVRFVRGIKSQTTDSLFDEFSAALQFPYYFGENWNAFNDCISDLEWLNCEFCVVVIFNAEQLLINEDKEEFETLLRILSEAMSLHTVGLQNVEGVIKNLPFYVVFQSEQKSISSLLERLEFSGITYKRLSDVM